MDNLSQDSNNNTSSAQAKGSYIGIAIAVIVLILLGGYALMRNKQGTSSLATQPSEVATSTATSTSGASTVEGTSTNSLSGSTKSTGAISAAEKEQVINLILNRKAILLSGDAQKIRTMLTQSGTDVSKVSDDDLIFMAKIAADALKEVTSELLRSTSTIWTVQGATLNVTIHPDKGAPIPVNFKKVNGVWQ